jgi:hypothetical protein
MGALNTLLVTFACTVGGAVVGMLLRPLLPQHHLRGGSKDAIKVSSAPLVKALQQIGR